MTRFPPIPNRSFNDSRIEDRIFERLQRRIWPIGVSIVFLILGLLFYFRWASVVSHSPSQWWSPGDLWDSFRASTTLVQGNFNGYSQWVFRGFGGRLILLAPLAAIKGAFSTTFVQIRDHGHLLAHPIVLHASGLPFNTTSIATLGAKQYAVLWPALAVALAIASRASTRRFGVAIGVVIATTIVAQWHLDIYPWWLLQVAGISGVLILAWSPEPVEQVESVAKPVRARTRAAPAQKQSGQSKKKRKSARTDRKKSAKR